MPRATGQPVPAWRGFVRLFLSLFVGVVAGGYLFILLIDPLDLVPFSLPIERPLVEGAQRYAYPQAMRSGRFDALIIGSSTARLIDPQALNGPFNARFANMAMNAAAAWEEWQVFEYFRRHAGEPKVLIIGIDAGWCDPQADVRRTYHGFPDWLYDDNRLNDYLNLFNTGALELSFRLIGYHLGLYAPRSRYDGFQIFTPPERDYDAARARAAIWLGRTPQPWPDNVPLALSDEERRALLLPALGWMDRMLAELPSTSVKVLALMPVHVAAQSWPGTRDAAIEAECKARIGAIARTRGATLIDWRIPSPITSDDANYWDGLHYRLPIAQQIARELVAAVLEGAQSPAGDYQLLR